MKQKPYHALRFRDLQIYLVGLFISILGSQMQTVAIAWQIYSITHSPVSLGFIGVVGFIPVILFFLIGGTIADSVNRKSLLLVTQLLLGVLAIILSYASYMHTISPTLIYIVLFCSASIAMIDFPARSAVLPSLVPKQYLTGAVSLMTVIRQAATIIGPAIAGFYIGRAGPAGVYLFNAISFLVLFVSLIFIHIPQENVNTKNPISLEGIKEGLTFIQRTPLIYLVMFLDFFGTFFASATVLLPVFAQDIFHIHVQELGFLYASPAIGALLAGLIITIVESTKNQGKILLSAVVIYGLFTIVFGLTTSFYVGMFALAVVGAGDMISTVIRNNLRQGLTPDRLRGRMTAISMVFFTGGPFLGDAEAGFLAGFIGAPLSVVSGGIAAVVSTLVITAKSKKLRNFRGDEFLSVS